MENIVNNFILILKDLYHTILIVIFHCLPIKRNKVVFSNFYGRGYGDNPKYIADEMIRRGLPYDIVWLLSNMDENIPSQIRKVKYNRIRCDYELATAKIIICNTKGDLHFWKKKGQYYIQTWHGSFGLKYIEGDAAKTLSKRYIRKSKSDSERTDLFISNSRLQTEEYKRAFWCTCEILESGFPRNDVLFSYIDKDIIKEKLGLDTNSGILLYAPTFRDNGDFSCYDIDYDRLLKTLHRLSNSEWTILVRLHPGMRKSLNLNGKNKNVIDVSSYSDGQELLCISDALISDYSSMMLDFAILRRPIFIFATDIEEYKKMRGLKPIYFDLPFDICTSNEMLMSKISSFDEQKYQSRLNQFFYIYHPIDQGNSTSVIVDRIEKFQQT